MASFHRHSREIMIAKPTLNPCFFGPIEFLFSIEYPWERLMVLRVFLVIFCLEHGIFFVTFLQRKSVCDAVSNSNVIKKFGRITKKMVAMRKFTFIRK